MGQYQYDLSILERQAAAMSEHEVAALDALIKKWFADWLYYTRNKRGPDCATGARVVDYRVYSGEDFELARADMGERTVKCLGYQVRQPIEVWKKEDGARVWTWRIRFVGWGQ